MGTLMVFDGEGGYEVLDGVGGRKIPIMRPIGHVGGVRHGGNATRHENASICGRIFVSGWRVGWEWRRTTQTQKTRPIRRVFCARGVKWAAGEQLGREGGC